MYQASRGLSAIVELLVLHALGHVPVFPGYATVCCNIRLLSQLFNCCCVSCVCACM